MKEDFCSLCDTVRIIGYDKNHKPFELPCYREHYIEISNETLLKVGVDEDCIKKLKSGKNVKANAQKILDGYKEYLRSVSGYKSEFESLEIVSPNSSQEDFQMKRIRKIMKEDASLEDQKKAHYEQVAMEEPKRKKSEEDRKKASEEYDAEINGKKRKAISDSIIFGV